MLTEPIDIVTQHASAIRSAEKYGDKLRPGVLQEVDEAAASIREQIHRLRNEAVAAHMKAAKP